MPKQHEGVMFLPAVFWDSDDDESPREAVITVLDGFVTIISRDDGLQVRLLPEELSALVRFACEEAERYDAQEGEEDDAEIDCILRNTGG